MNDIEQHLKKMRLASPSAELDRRMSETLAAAAQTPRSSRRVSHLRWLVALTAAGTVAGFLLMFPRARQQHSKPVVYRIEATGRLRQMLVEAPSNASSLPPLTVSQGIH
jgi:anti-sigma-K factor RskA